MSQILDYNPLSGITTEMQYDHSTDMVNITTHQDVSEIIEQNKREIIELDHSKKDAMRHYARIPPVVIMHWKQKYGVDFFNRDHWPRVMKLINSAEYRDLKTTTMHHDR